MDFNPNWFNHVFGGDRTQNRERAFWENFALVLVSPVSMLICAYTAGAAVKTTTESSVALLGGIGIGAVVGLFISQHATHYVDAALSEQSDDSESIYERTVDEQLDHLDVSCDTHGELDSSDLSITMDSSLVCGYCSINQEMDVRNERDIDASVELDFQRDD